MANVAFVVFVVLSIGLAYGDLGNVLPDVVSGTEGKFETLTHHLINRFFFIVSFRLGINSLASNWKCGNDWHRIEHRMQNTGRK